MHIISHLNIYAYCIYFLNINEKCAGEQKNKNRNFIYYL